MHVLMLTSFLDSSLREQGFIVDWAEALAAQVDWLSLVVLAEPRSQLKAKNTSLIILDQNSSGAKLIEFFRATNTLHRQRPIDRVFCHMYDFLGVLGGAWGRWHRVPSLMWYAGGLELKRYSTLDLAFRLNNALVTCSAAAADRYRSFYDLHKPVLNIGHAIDGRRFPLISRNYKPNNGKMVIGSVGRMSPEKNFELLIEALALDQDQNYRLELITTRLEYNPSYTQQIQSVLEEKGLDYKLHVDVPYNRVPKLMDHWHVYVHPGTVKAIDKSGLESIFTGIPGLYSEVSYGEALADWPENIIHKMEPRPLFEQIERLRLEYDVGLQKQTLIAQAIRSQYNTEAFMKKLVDVMLS